jgi:hypothetical protein
MNRRLQGSGPMVAESTDPAAVVRSDQPSANGVPKRTSVVSSRWQLKLFFGVVAATVAAYIGYVIAFGVNVVFWDDWAWVGFAVDPWRQSLGNLWTQHTENIVFFPNVVAAVLIPLTRWNSLAFMWLAAAMLIATLGISIYIFWEEIKTSPLRWIPLPLIILTLTQYQNTLWSFQIAWFMVLLASFGAFALLSRRELSTSLFICAALLGVVGSYSSFSGLLIWPVGLVVLLSKGQAARWRILWCTIGVLVTTGFFAYVNWAETNSASLSYILAHLTLVVRGVLITAGSVIPNTTAGIAAISSFRITEIIGAILLGSGLGVIADWIRRGRASGAPAFCVGLIVMSILFDLSLIPSRLVYVPFQGATSRYDTFMWPLLLGIYSYAAINVRGVVGKRRWVLLPITILALVLGSAIVLGTIVGINQGQVTRTVRLTAADVLANLPSAPTAVAAPYLFPPCANDVADCAQLDAQAHALEVQHVSVFSDSNEVQQLRSLGVVPGGVATRLLAVPRSLRAQVNATNASRAAWNALSATYWSDPAFLQQYPQTMNGTARFLMWAVASAASVNPQVIINDEWSPPVSDPFFLVQYEPIYQSWLSSGKS